MSTEIKAKILNPQYTCDKAQRYVKLALAIVNAASENNTRFVNGGIHAIAENIIPKNPIKMHIDPIESGIEPSISDLLKIEQYYLQEIKKQTFSKIEAEFKKHNEATQDIKKLASELKEPE